MEKIPPIAPFKKCVEVNHITKYKCLQKLSRFLMSNIFYNFTGSLYFMVVLFE